MVKTLEQIQDEIAKEYGFGTWEFVEIQMVTPHLLGEVVKRYAIEAIKSDRISVAKNAKMRFETYDGEIEVLLDKESIFNLPIELP